MRADSAGNIEVRKDPGNKGESMHGGLSAWTDASGSQGGLTKRNEKTRD